LVPAPDVLHSSPPVPSTLMPMAKFSPAWGVSASARLTMRAMTPAIAAAATATVSAHCTALRIF
jgi:hypothetical protein